MEYGNYCLKSDFRRWRGNSCWAGCLVGPEVVEFDYNSYYLGEDGEDDRTANKEGCHMIVEAGDLSKMCQVLALVPNFQWTAEVVHFDSY